MYPASGWPAADVRRDSVGGPPGASIRRSSLWSAATRSHASTCRMINSISGSWSRIMGRLLWVLLGRAKRPQSTHRRPSGTKGPRRLERHAAVAGVAAMRLMASHAGGTWTTWRLSSCWPGSGPCPWRLAFPGRPVHRRLGAARRHHIRTGSRRHGRCPAARRRARAGLANLTSPMDAGPASLTGGAPTSGRHRSASGRSAAATWPISCCRRPRILGGLYRPIPINRPPTIRRIPAPPPRRGGSNRGARPEPGPPL